MNRAEKLNALLELLRAKELKIATAESCTGGLIAAAITDVAGASDVFECGFVTYSNKAKTDMIKVSPETLELHGAVSSETAEEMAKGALLNSSAHITVSVTGIAGPGGATETKPVGLVYFGVATKDTLSSDKQIFSGNRHDIREQTVDHALDLLMKKAQNFHAA